MALGCLLGITQSLRCRLLKHVIVAAVGGELARVQMHDIRADRVQELASVAHHQQCLGPLEQVLLRA